MGSIAAADVLQIVQFRLLAALLGTMLGFALAGSVYFIAWFRSVLRLFEQAPRRLVLLWVLVVIVIGAVVLLSLFAGSTTGMAAIDIDLARQTRPVIVVTALCCLPGFLIFVAIRGLALDRRSWSRDGEQRLAILMRSRFELRRITTAFGALLTLIVVTTGLRRRTLLSFDPNLPIPAEQVLLYGLVFAVVLGAFFGVANAALDRRSDQLLDEFAPLPSPSDEDLGGPIGRRNDLAGLVGSGGSWRTFQTSVVIAAPLLTALIGSATGG